jgi:oligopeptide transport system substrate-binding protein
VTRSGIFLVALWALAGPAAAEAVLRVAVPSLPSQLDPQTALTAIDRALSRELFEGLVAVDAEGRLVPGLAESWTVEGGGTRYVFKLRRGLAWSDGRPLTGDDVAAGLQRALDPTTGAPLAASLLAIRNAGDFQLGTLAPGQTLGVTVRPDDSVVIELGAPSFRLLHVLASPVAAAVPRHRIAQLGVAWSAPFLTTVSGPFAPVPAGDRFGLRENPRHWRAAATAIDRIAFETVASLDAARDAVRTGRAEIALGFDPEPIIGRDEATLRPDAGSATYRWIANTTRPPLDRYEVRHALAMAIDREALIDALNIRDARPAFSLTPPGIMPDYDPPLAPYAKLKQAERDVIADVLLIDTDRTQPIRIALAVSEGAIHAAIAERARASWRVLGFEAAIVTRDAAAHEQALLAGDFDVAVAAGQERDADPWPLLFPFARAAGPLNLTRYQVDEFDERLIPADTETNPEYRRDQLRAAEGVLSEDQAVWPLLFFAPAAPVAPGLDGWVPNPADIHPISHMVLNNKLRYK